MDGFRLSGRMLNAQQGKALLDRYYLQCKPVLIAGHMLRVVVTPDTRTLDQNAKFHALCSDIAASGLTWAGEKRTPKQWKVLLVSGHAVATGDGAELTQGLEGEMVNLRESTALMSVRRGASLIEYALAFCAHNGVQIHTSDEVPS